MEEALAFREKRKALRLFKKQQSKLLCNIIINDMIRYNVDLFIKYYPELVLENIEYIDQRLKMWRA